MIAPRMLGPEVRRCYEEGAGFITALGVQRDATGEARPRTLAVAHALGGLREGAIALTPHQEAVLDLGGGAGALARARPRHGRLRRGGCSSRGSRSRPCSPSCISPERSSETIAGCASRASPGSSGITLPRSQYGQLSRRDAYAELDFAPRMQELVETIRSGGFADEWDAEAAAGHPTLGGAPGAVCRRRHSDHGSAISAADSARKSRPDRIRPGASSCYPRRRSSRRRPRSTGLLRYSGASSTSSIFGKRRASASNASCASSRASGAPRQKGGWRSRTPDAGSDRARDPGDPALRTRRDRGWRRRCWRSPWRPPGSGAHRSRWARGSRGSSPAPGRRSATALPPRTPQGLDPCTGAPTRRARAASPACRCRSGSSSSRGRRAAGGWSSRAARRR